MPTDKMISIFTTFSETRINDSLEQWKTPHTLDPSPVGGAELSKTLRTRRQYVGD
jgi:hypothetical protein